MSKKNLFGEELQRCVAEGGGSSLDGMCVADPIHRVCVRRLGSYDAPSGGKVGFSAITGQGPWSEGRGDASHCVCSGAYANYVSRADDKTGEPLRLSIDCAATPHDALREAAGTRTWNDVTIGNQFDVALRTAYADCSKQIPAGDTRRANRMRRELSRNTIALHKK